MKKVKLAIVYQVIFHYRIPFYNEIENDPQIESILLHGSGVSGTKLKNASHNLKQTQEVFSLKFPYAKNKYFSFFPFLFFKLINVNPDVILLEGSSSIINNISTFVYAGLFRKKIIYWSLGKVKNKKLSTMRQKVDNIILFMEKKANAIFTYSSLGEAYFLQRGIKENKIFKGVNVLDTRKILETVKPTKIANNEFKILFVGSIIPEKNLEVLIDAFLKLERYCSNVTLDIVGSGAEYYKLLFDKYQKVSKNLIFHGRITEGLDYFYLQSDVFVLPGLGGLAISESMAYGLPVICSVADGTEKDLIDENSGYIIENMTSDTLFEKLDYLNQNRNVLQKMGINAKQRIKTTYSFENYYKTFKKCLKYSYEN